MLDSETSNCHTNNNEETHSDAGSDCERDCYQGQCEDTSSCCSDSSKSSNCDENCSSGTNCDENCSSGTNCQCGTVNASVLDSDLTNKRDSNSSAKDNVVKFEEMCKLYDDERHDDFESSIRSESAVTMRRKPNRNREAQQSRRSTKVVGHKWMIPPRPKSFTAPDRSERKQVVKMEPASLPSMLDAEVRMSSILGPVSLPVDIPVQRASTAPTPGEVADMGFESIPEAASCSSTFKNKNNSRHNNEESLDPCSISILVTPSESGDNMPEDELSKRRKDPYVAAFLEKFRTAYYCFRVVLQESVPTSKFQWLCKCLKEVNDVAEKQAQFIFCKYKFVSLIMWSDCS